MGLHEESSEAVNADDIWQETFLVLCRSKYPETEVMFRTVKYTMNEQVSI